LQSIDYNITLLHYHALPATHSHARRCRSHPSGTNARPCSRLFPTLPGELPFAQVSILDSCTYILSTLFIFSETFIMCQVRSPKSPKFIQFHQSFSYHTFPRKELGIIHMQSQFPDSLHKKRIDTMRALFNSNHHYLGFFLLSTFR